jgi:hypothetical protein
MFEQKRGRGRIRNKLVMPVTEVGESPLRHFALDLIPVACDLIPIHDGTPWQEFEYD